MTVTVNDGFAAYPAPLASAKVVRQREMCGMDQSPSAGGRLTDKATVPDDMLLRHWLGPDAFARWSVLRDWIAAAYPHVFTPDWLYGGKKHGWSLRYKKSRAFCTLVPEYCAFSAVVVLGGAEREKVEARRNVLTPRLMTQYDATETYHDGKWLKLGISSLDDLKDVTDLLTLKRPPNFSAPLG